MKISLIFPHQLYKISDHPALSKDRKVILLENPLFFRDNYYGFKFHKQKLVLHRASMKCYQDKLEQRGFKTEYISRADIENLNSLYTEISKNCEKIVVCDPTDYILEKRIREYSGKHDLEIKWKESPNFINSRSDLKEYFSGNDFFQTKFYKRQRRELDILMEDVEPEGGKWSFDQDNRKRLPEDVSIPDRINHKNKKEIKEAKEYVQKNFSEHPGKLENFNYPVTRRQALAELRDFFENRLSDFGPYQDAISNRDEYLFHSKLSSSLNVGLLDPMEIAKKAERFYYNSDIQLQSVEGFIRQIIGWREFMRAVYKFKGSKQRSSNYFNNQRELSEKFYTAEIGIKPIDDVIEKTRGIAYGHHIERLMLLGNFMLLCGINPKEVYKWFMEMFIDAYDWVMVPNVYGMSQYSNGGEVVTKPYISSSNYILKMSDYSEGEWCEIWDSLYWRFINKHKDKLSNNPRMGFILNLLDKKSSEQIKSYHQKADRFLSDL